MKAQVGKTYLTEIPHKGGNLTFQHPAFNGYFGKVAESIEKSGLIKPTSSETASLIYDAFQNKEGKYESEIIKILEDAWFWEFTINHYLPKSNEEINNGVILHPAEFDKDGNIISDKNNLIKRLENNDPNVKFVPFGYKIGEQNPFELMKNSYIVARYGEEESQKIAEIASKYKSNPKLFTLDNSINEEKIRISALLGLWGLGDRLYVNGGWDDLSNGHSFGVCALENDK